MPRRFLKTKSQRGATMNEPQIARKWDKDDPVAQQQLQTMLMYYPRLLDDMREWQRRQWHIVYYAFLLLGGIIALHDRLSDSSYQFYLDNAILIVTIAEALVAGFSILMIWLLECAALRARINVWKTRIMYRSLFSPLSVLERGYTKYCYHWKALVTQSVAILFALLFAIGYTIFTLDL